MRTKLLMLLTALWWTLGAAAQDWETADSLAPAMADTTNYEAPVQRNFNALQYSLDDYHRFTGDRFDRPLSFFGMGGGRMTINDLRLKKVEGSSYNFDDTSYDPATTDKQNVKAFQLRVVVNVGGETGEITQVAPVPSNGPGD